MYEKNRFAQMMFFLGVAFRAAYLLLLGVSCPLLFGIGLLKTIGAAILISSHNLKHTIDISTHILLLEHCVIIKNREKYFDDYAENAILYSIKS